MIASIVFYIASALLIGSAAMVVTARNPVHAVLFLILAFFNAAVLFLIAGAEFLAMALVIVYVGAVAVLFLFVVMMLDIDFTQLREGFQRYLPVGLAVASMLLLELFLVLGGRQIAPAAMTAHLAPAATALGNTDAIGRVLYTENALLFQIAGLVLLVAMIGAIVLTLRDRQASRRQDVGRQTARRVAETLQMVHLEFGAGVTKSAIIRPLPDPANREPEPIGGDAPGGGSHHGPERR
jgi:NADH-quinone oxidoreductase subunit J